MPVRNYGVLKGRVLNSVPEHGDKFPHYQIHVLSKEKDGGATHPVHYRVAVNVRSRDSGHPELYFYVAENFRHPLLERLAEVPEGFTPLPQRTPGGGGLDYIRGNLFDRRKMAHLPHDLPGRDNDLNEKLDFYIQMALRRPETARLYAFGSRWGAEPHPDHVFHFAPGNGLHNVHMNQGSPRTDSHSADNGVWQDGALLIHLPERERWVGLFLAFQTQVWHTSDRTGHPHPHVRDRQGVGTANRPGHREPDGRVRIVAALVNPEGPDPGFETVTLLNTGPDPIDLRGWHISDQRKGTMPLTGVLPPNDPLTVTLVPELVQLSNRGDIITVLDETGLKVDGVSYTAEAAKENRLLVF